MYNLSCVCCGQLVIPGLLFGAVMCVLSHALPSDIHASAKPDERSIMTYVSAYYHCFASSQKVSNGSGWAGVSEGPSGLFA